MASGRLGAVSLAAETNTLVYEVPAGTVATVNVSVVNRGDKSVEFRLAHLDGAIGTLADEDYIEYDTRIEGKDVLERTGIVMAATHTIMAYSEFADVSVQVWGWEESI